MTQICVSPQSFTPSPRKGSKADKQMRIQGQRDRMCDMLSSFYQKTTSKVQKALNKDNKKVMLLSKELFGILSQHPHQQIYELTRLNDMLFNEIASLNDKIGQFLKQIESLRIKVGQELAAQIQRTSKKQEKQELGQANITFLRKINFKKDKNSLGYRLKQLDVINNKLIKCEEPLKAEQYQGPKGCFLQIEGKRLQCQVYKYSKIWFQAKQKYYILFVTLKKGSNQNREAQMSIYNDKLQQIAIIPHLPSVDIINIQEVVQLQNHLFMITSHKIVRISLINDNQCKANIFSQKILKAYSYEEGIALWVEEADACLSVFMINSQLQIYSQQYLKLNVKTVYNFFKIISKNQQIIYFTAKNQYNVHDLYALKGMVITLIIKDIGYIQQIITNQNILQFQCTILKKGNSFFKFNHQNQKIQPLSSDIENAEQLIRCCILGEHLYSLHQSGKYVIQCHLRGNDCD